jgi:hypothetical protein
MAKLLAHRDAEIPSLQSANDEVPEWIETVFRKMVAKRRSDRYQSMTEVIRALESGQGGSSVNMSIPRMPDTILLDLDSQWAGQVGYLVHSTESIGRIVVNSFAAARPLKHCLS